ncbi:MAG: ribosome silencing factor [Thermodesulfobacteriota bacterium]
MNVSSEIPHEPNSREKAEMLLRTALSKKASSPVLIRLADLTSLTDYFLILTARSARHVAAVAEAIEAEAKQARFRRPSVEGLPPANWVLLDFGDLVVHVFQPGARDFYDLEGLWADAPRERFSPETTREIEAAAAKDEDYEDEPDDW